MIFNDDQNDNIPWSLGCHGFKTFKILNVVWFLLIRIFFKSGVVPQDW